MNLDYVFHNPNMEWEGNLLDHNLFDPAAEAIQALRYLKENPEAAEGYPGNLQAILCDNVRNQIARDLLPFAMRVWNIRDHLKPEHEAAKEPLAQCVMALASLRTIIENWGWPDDEFADIVTGDGMDMLTEANTGLINALSIINGTGDGLLNEILK